MSNVYGICENKCLKEVIAKENIVVLEKEGEGSNTFNFSFPAGFNTDNTMILSVQRNTATTIISRPGEDDLVGEPAEVYANLVGVVVKFNTTVSSAYKVKVTLLKYKD